MKRLLIGFGSLAALTALTAGFTFAGSSSGSKTTVISGSGNGVGNHIAVSGASGQTVIQGSRLGIGNTIEVKNNGSSIRIDDDGVSLDGVPQDTHHRWSKRVWSEKLNDYLYWSPRTKSWYRFDRDDRAFYPLEVYPSDK